MQFDCQQLNCIHVNDILSLSRKHSFQIPCKYLLSTVSSSFKSSAAQYCVTCHERLMQLTPFILFGISTIIVCGLLFTRSSGRPLLSPDTGRIITNHQLSVGDFSLHSCQWLYTEIRYKIGQTGLSI